ncbi:putative C6 transcription factor [Aspergillus candidus]|uniref:Zn(2)-C6 fungal-type domain-containing protein n=1 Tax=Aspergillus candidus TaxID=41067 RepID=A0A2I2FMU4_ASPCN|nr:hypothetical protein BDW47DRAFT_98837 [Aspergillus candidus]PLB41939.1 hypothetical protein BDW47DRAFT_98837 [Aspergillus candidus]
MSFLSPEFAHVPTEPPTQSGLPPTNTGDAAKSSQEPLGLRSCVTCRRRKVRCNKRCPCSNCTRAGIECVFPPPGRAPRKSKRPVDAELLSRLRRLEGVIEHLNDKNIASQERSKPPSPQQSHDASVSSSECPGNTESPGDPEVCPFLDPNKPAQPRNLDHEFGRLVIDEGRSRYVSNRFWTSLGDEIEELQDILDPPSSDEEDTSSPESASGPFANHDGFLFGYYSLAHSLRSFFPPLPSFPALWDIYTENVAPLIQVVHKPTARKIFMSASQQPESLDRNHEALFLALVLVSIVSMSPEQCMSILGKERDLLVSRYRFAVEQALSRADFLNTQSLVLLQAAVIFLIGVRREDDTRFVWSMTALVLRVAQGLGIHRDGSNFGLKPFETEMRRRLWWHICMLDIRSSEDHGTNAQIHDRMYDTRLPLNINDDDITPEMEEPPKEREGFTDMTFCLIRGDITVALRRVSNTGPNTTFSSTNMQLSPSMCSKLIHATNQRIEAKYLRHCDTSVPIQWVCATVARLILTKLWLVIHHPMTRPDQGVSLNTASRESLFKTSVEVAEFACLLTTDKNTQKWGWMFTTNMQWHAIAFILSELCVRPEGPLTDRAWYAVGTLYEDWVRTAKSRKGMLWRPLSRLMKRASAARAKQQAQMQSQFDPNLIVSNASLLPVGAALPTIAPLILPRVPETQYRLSNLPGESQGSSSTGSLDVPDLRDGVSDAMDQVFPDVDPLAPLNPQEPSLAQLPETDAEGLPPVPDISLDPMEFTQNGPPAQLNWDEWDEVMREFQMDMQEAQTENPIGNLTSNVSDWYAL